MTLGSARWAKALPAAIALLLWALAAWSGGEAEDSAKPPSTRIRVVATTNILGDIARNVVGDLGEVEASSFSRSGRESTRSLTASGSANARQSAPIRTSGPTRTGARKQRS